MNLLNLATHAAPRLFAIRKSTWISLGIGLLVLFGLLIWAAVASVSWLWGHAPNVAETGKRMTDVALAQVEQVAPGLKEQAAILLPGVINHEPPLRDSLLRDVSGPDIGPDVGVARYPGLARDFYRREGKHIEVHYTGPADFQSVLTHYTGSFAAAGYRQEILSASREVEQHRYTKGNDLIEFNLLKKPRDRVQVELHDTL